MINKISHIAIVVPDLEEAMTFWVNKLGLPLDHIEYVEDQGVDVAFLPAGESDIELLRPLDKDSGVARYMQKRGPGVHHICFEVDDIQNMLDQLKAAGIPLINEEPTIGTGGKKIAFLHPKGTGGVLVELYELTEEEPQRRLERRQLMLRRVTTNTRIYAAGFLSFVAGLIAPGNGRDNQQEPENV